MQIRQKKLKKLEEAELDNQAEAGVIYDEDDDADGEVRINLDEEEEDEDDEWGDSDDEDRDMYETKLDKVDDILFVKDQLDLLSQSN